ncbi:RebB family R body protein [Derxia gummosa]|uniref:RebB family R body protein n=1 Tax=Derxia gummosa DSM 723 TaxID=1121388 RepID=A0A8B6X3I8_9BURK|nr:RebB family R body protein [Derxia gummosa]
MAHPTPVNDQIIDAVTRSNVKVADDAPAIATGEIYPSLQRPPAADGKGRDGKACFLAGGQAAVDGSPGPVDSIEDAMRLMQSLKNGRQG